MSNEGKYASALVRIWRLLERGADPGMAIEVAANALGLNEPPADRDALADALIAWAADEKKIACHSQGYNVCIFCYGYLDDDLGDWNKEKPGHKDNCLHLRARALLEAQ